MENERRILGKTELKGHLICLTGMHIGASKETVEIGALDSPVVRDPKTREPYIPGSSLKGKLRSLLEKANPKLPLNRNGGTAQNPIMRHECDNWGEEGGKFGALYCPVCRLFGSTGSRNYPARLKVRDLELQNREDLEKMDTGLFLTEWKFENGIDRITSAANPRNIERVPKGAKFGFSMIYDVEDVTTLKEDLENLYLAVRLLHDDALGGHGSRGYGQVKMNFDQIEARHLEFYKGKSERKLSFEGLDHQTLDALVKFFANNGG